MMKTTLMKGFMFPLKLNINIMISNFPQEKQINFKEMQIYPSPKEEGKEK